MVDVLYHGSGVGGPGAPTPTSSVKHGLNALWLAVELALGGGWDLLGAAKQMHAHTKAHSHTLNKETLVMGLNRWHCGVHYYAQERRVDAHKDWRGPGSAMDCMLPLGLLVQQYALGAAFALVTGYVLMAQLLHAFGDHKVHGSWP